MLLVLLRPFSAVPVYVLCLRLGGVGSLLAAVICFRQLAQSGPLAIYKLGIRTGTRVQGLQFSYSSTV